MAEKDVGRFIYPDKEIEITGMGNEVPTPPEARENPWPIKPMVDIDTAIASFKTYLNHSRKYLSKDNSAELKTDEKRELSEKFRRVGLMYAKGSPELLLKSLKLADVKQIETPSDARSYNRALSTMSIGVDQYRAPDLTQARTSQKLPEQSLTLDR